MNRWSRLAMVMVVVAAVLSAGCDDDLSAVHGVVESFGSGDLQVAVGVAVGITVELLDVTEAVIETALTDAEGKFAFKNLDPGEYTVRLTSGRVTGDVPFTLGEDEDLEIIVWVDGYGAVTADLTKTKSNGTTETIHIEPETMTVYWCKYGVTRSAVVTVAEYEASPGKWLSWRPNCQVITEVVVDQVSLSPGWGGPYDALASPQRLGQTFRAGRTGKLVKMDLEIFLNANPGDVIVAIQTAPGGDINNAGAVDLGTATIPAASITAPPIGDVTVTFGGNIQLTAGADYAFRLESPTAGPGGFNVIDAATYSGAGRAWVSFPPGPYVLTGITDDLPFKTYMEVVK
jgi:hypothetical protein